MSIVPSPSRRQMKKICFQNSDVIITKSISWAHEGNFCMWAGIIGPFSKRQGLGLLVASLLWFFRCYACLFYVAF